MKTAPFALGVGTKIIIGQQVQESRGIDADKGLVLLKNPLSGTEIRMNVVEVALMFLTGEAKPAHEAPPKYSPTGKPHLKPLAEDDPRWVTIHRRMAYGQALGRLGSMGPKNPVFILTVAEIGNRLGDPHPPSPDSVYRWARRYRNSGFDTAVFMQDGNVTRTRTPRVDPAVATILKAHVQNLLGQFMHATVHGVTDLALALTAKDLGHITFIAKDGTEAHVDSFIPLATEILSGAVRGKRARARARGGS